MLTYSRICEIDPNYTKNIINNMFHVTDTILVGMSVGLAIHTTLMFVLPSNTAMMLRWTL